MRLRGCRLDFGKFSWRDRNCVIGRELERERKTFMERGILRKAELQNSLIFLIFLFISCPLLIKVQSCLELWAGWGMLSLIGGGYFTSFSHSSRLSQIWNACLMYRVTTCFQAWPKFMLNTHFYFKQKLKLNLLYLLILKFTEMLFLLVILYQWKISIFFKLF